MTFAEVAKGAVFVWGNRSWTKISDSSYRPDGSREGPGAARGVNGNIRLFADETLVTV